MEKKDLKIVFLGTPDFAVESLRRLVEGGYNIVGVITMPDKIAGRGHKMFQSPVKEYAVEPCPAKPSWMDNLMSDLDGSDYLEENLRLALGAYYSPLRFVATSASQSPLQARVFFVPNFK